VCVCLCVCVCVCVCFFETLENKLFKKMASISLEQSKVEDFLDKYTDIGYVDCLFLYLIEDF